MQRYIDWLKRGIARPGKSQAGLARHLGVTDSTISKMLKGKRRVQIGELARIEAYLEEAAPRDDAQVARNLTATSGVKVVFVARENSWQERAHEDTHDEVPAVISADFTVDRQYAVEAEYLHERGAQTFFVCVPIEEIGRAVKIGDIVHVVRTRGDLRQILMRKVIRQTPRSDGRSDLVLRSLGPTAPDLPLSTSEIKGIAIGAFTRFKV